MTEVKPSEPTILELIIGLGREVIVHRRIFAIVLTIALVASVSGVMLVTPRYRAKATIMPPADQAGVNGLLSSFGSMAGLAGLAGGGSSADLYPIVARSRRVLDGVLARPFGDSTMQEILLKGESADSTSIFLLRSTLQEKIKAGKNLKTGVVSISYAHGDRYFAAALVNGLLDEMEAFFDEEMITEVHNQKSLLEARLASVGDSLRVQEERMEGFLLDNRDFQQSPRLQIKEERLRRDLNLSNGIYQELMRQYEIIKIQDMAQSPSLKVLDRASVPMVHFWPERRKIVLMSLVGAFALTLLWVKIFPILQA